MFSRVNVFILYVYDSIYAIKNQIKNEKKVIKYVPIILCTLVGERFLLCNNFEKWYSVQSVYRKVNHIPTADELEEEYIYLQDAAKLSGVTQSTITKWDASWQILISSKSY